MSPLSRVVIAAVAATALTGAGLARAAPAEAGGRLYAIGDSWAAGYAADPIHALLQDAADDLGMTAAVDGEGGSGYLTAPPGTRTYPQRAASIPAGTAADIVVVQGGSNDDFADLGALPAAVDATVEGVHRSLPRAAIVLLGPGPDPWPVTALQLRVDRILAAEAGRLHVRYVSPLGEGWFTGQDIDEIIDPVTHHPSVAGDEILGARFAADLRPLHHRHPVRIATRSASGLPVAPSSDRGAPDRVPDLSRFFTLLAAVPVPPDAEPLWDPSTAAGALRLQNLRRYLDLVGDADTALVAEAPGHRGATVTGVPFMSLKELTARPGLLTDDAAGDGFAIPAGPAPAWEASSAIVWSALSTWGRPLPVSWPIVPHHPFRAGDPGSNRTPRQAEVRDGTPVALELLAAFGIRRVVAVGRKAEAALAAAGVEAVPVRHPAQGGAARFTEGVRRLAPG